MEADAAMARELAEADSSESESGDEQAQQPPRQDSMADYMLQQPDIALER